MSDKSAPERFVDKLRRILRAINSSLSRGFDHVIYAKKASLFVSFLAAAVICIAVNYQDLAFTFFNRDATTYNLSAVPVEIQADTDNYEVTGLPSTVDLTVTGDAADVQVFRNNQSNVAVIANLRDFGEGNNVVTFVPANVSGSLSVTITPATADVRLDRKITRTFQVSPELMLGSGQKESDFQTPELTDTKVNIKATRAQLDSIRTVKALVDVSGQTGDISTVASVVAYNGSGEKMNVQITPETIQAEVREAVPADSQEQEDKNNG